MVFFDDPTRFKIHSVSWEHTFVVAAGKSGVLFCGLSPSVDDSIHRTTVVRDPYARWLGAIGHQRHNGIKSFGCSAFACKTKTFYFDCASNVNGMKGQTLVWQE